MIPESPSWAELSARLDDLEGALAGRLRVLLAPAGRPEAEVRELLDLYYVATAGTDNDAEPSPSLISYFENSPYYASLIDAWNRLGLLPDAVADPIFPTVWGAVLQIRRKGYQENEPTPYERRVFDDLARVKLGIGAFEALIAPAQVASRLKDVDSELVKSLMENPVREAIGKQLAIRADFKERSGFCTQDSRVLERFANYFSAKPRFGQVLTWTERIARWLRAVCASVRRLTCMIFSKWWTFRIVNRGAEPSDSRPGRSALARPNVINFRCLRLGIVPCDERRWQAMYLWYQKCEAEAAALRRSLGAMKVEVSTTLREASFMKSSVAQIRRAPRMVNEVAPSRENELYPFAKGQLTWCHIVEQAGNRAKQVELKLASLHEEEANRHSEVIEAMRDYARRAEPILDRHG